MLREILTAEAVAKGRPPCEAHVRDLYGDGFAVTLLKIMVVTTVATFWLSVLFMWIDDVPQAGRAALIAGIYTLVEGSLWVCAHWYIHKHALPDAEKLRNRRTAVKGSLPWLIHDPRAPSASTSDDGSKITHRGDFAGKPDYIKWHASVWAESFPSWRRSASQHAFWVLLAVSVVSIALSCHGALLNAVELDRDRADGLFEPDSAFLRGEDDESEWAAWIAVLWTLGMVTFAIGYFIPGLYFIPMGILYPGWVTVKTLVVTVVWSLCPVLVYTVFFQCIRGRKNMWFDFDQEARGGTGHLAWHILPRGFVEFTLFLKPVYMLLASRPTNQRQTPKRELSMLVVTMLSVHAGCMLLFVLNFSGEGAGPMLMIWVFTFSSMLYVCYKAKILALTPEVDGDDASTQGDVSSCTTAVVSLRDNGDAGDSEKNCGAYQHPYPVFPALFFSWLHTWGLAGGAIMPICVQYIFNTSPGTTVAMSVATAAFLDYVWGTACTYLADAGLRDENLILLDLSTLTMGDNVLKFTSLALLSGNIFDPRNDSGGMAFWISLLLGNITTLILSANGHKQLVSGALKDFPAEVRGALHSIISSSMTALPASLGILFVFTTDLVLIKTTKLERGCLLCDVAEYGPSMMRLVVSLFETYLFSWAMKWLLTTVCHRRLSSRRGTESIKPGRANLVFPKTGEKHGLQGEASLRELFHEAFPIADAAQILDRLDAHSQSTGSGAAVQLVNLYLSRTLNIYWRTTIRELVFRALCGFVVSWLYSILQFAPCTNPDRPLIDYNWAYSDFWNYT